MSRELKQGYLERYSNDWDAYQKKLSEWEMMRSCDATNKPGYYRANNDQLTYVWRKVGIRAPYHYQS